MLRVWREATNIVTTARDELKKWRTWAESLMVGGHRSFPYGHEDSRSRQPSLLPPLSWVLGMGKISRDICAWLASLKENQIFRIPLFLSPSETF
jgi:hypothetical protein